jgi:hypothetical protein
MSQPIHSKVSLGLVAVFIVTGCGRKEAAPPAQSGKSTATSSVESLAKQEAATPPTPPPPPRPTGNAGTDAAPAATDAPLSAQEEDLLQSVFKASRNFYADKLHYARDLDELVKAGYLKRAPVAPPGKKFVFDSKSFTVRLVSE